MTGCIGCGGIGWSLGRMRIRIVLAVGSAVRGWWRAARIVTAGT